jgi:hypothetical protein
LLRRAGTTEADDDDRGCLDSGEDRDEAAQCVARLVSRRPKGAPKRGCMPGEQVQLGTRQRLLGGGCRDSGSGELVAWLGPHAGVQDYWVREEALGVLKWPQVQAERGAHRRRQWRPRRGSGARARKDGWAFISRREAVVWNPCAPRR